MGKLEITIPLNYQITDTSKTVLKQLIAETIGEALTKSNAVFPSEDALRTFVRDEVRKALAENIKKMSFELGARTTKRP